jgi:hypothetical protein
MAKKKVTPKKKVGGKKKSSAGVKKSAALKKIVKKVAPKSAPKKKIVAKKAGASRVVATSAAKKSASVATSTPKKSNARKVRGITEEIHSPMKSSLVDGGDFGVEPRRPKRGTGSAAAGQSGDTEGISDESEADSESVEELLEEGQSFEAEVISGVEKAGNADDGGVRTHEVPEDDVPEEYENQD